MLIRNIGKLRADFTDLRHNIVNLAANPQIFLEHGRHARWQAKVSETFSPRWRMVRCRREVPA
jgi:hypothetical protein